MTHTTYPSHLGPKVTILCPTSATPPIAVMNDDIEKLFNKLCKRKPEWSFVLTNVNMYQPVGPANTFHCNKIIIYQDGEHLGHAQRSRTPAGGWAYGIDCPVLNRGRKRGYETRTAKLDKAVAIITDNFRPKPDLERNKETYVRVRSNISQALFNATSVKNNISSVRGIVETWLVENIDGLRERILLDTNLSDTALDYYVKVLNKHSEVRSLVENLTDYKVLICKDGNYSWIDGHGCVVQQHTTDTLPDAVKSKIAKLKLVEAEQMIAGVGYRAGPDTYIVMETTR